MIRITLRENKKGKPQYRNVTAINKRRQCMADRRQDATDRRRRNADGSVVSDFSREMPIYQMNGGTCEQIESVMSQAMSFF